MFYIHLYYYIFISFLCNNKGSLLCRFLHCTYTYLLSWSCFHFYEMDLQFCTLCWKNYYLLYDFGSFLLPAYLNKTSYTSNINWQEFLLFHSLRNPCVIHCVTHCSTLHNETVVTNKNYKQIKIKQDEINNVFYLWIY